MSRSRRLRVGLVGSGRWAIQHHLPAVEAHPSADLVAVHDIDELRMAQFACLVPGVRTTEDVEDLIDHSDLDALIVASPPAFHHNAVASALQIGIAVMVEKPFALDPVHGWDLVRRARGVPLVVGLTHQFSDASAAVRGWLAAGTIGTIGAITGTYHAPRSHLYAPDYATAGSGSRDLDRPLGATFADPAIAGGGQLINQMTHLLGSIIGATRTPLVRVAGAELRAAGPTVSGVEVTAAALFLADDGALVSVASHGAARAEHLTICFDGTRGRIDWDLRTGQATLWVEAKNRLEVAESAVAYPGGAPVECLLRLVQTPEENNPAPGFLGAHLVDVISAAYQAAETQGHRPIAAPLEWW